MCMFFGLASNYKVVQIVSNSFCTFITCHWGLLRVILPFFCIFCSFKVKPGYVISGRINKELSLRISSWVSHRRLLSKEPLKKSLIYSPTRHSRSNCSWKCCRWWEREDYCIVKHICIIAMLWIREVNVHRWMDYTKVWYRYGHAHRHTHLSYRMRMSVYAQFHFS